MTVHQDAPPADADEALPKCVVDRSVLNADTITDLQDIGLSVFATLCGKNRGAFVTQPPDGQTYSCLHFPKNFAQIAGVVTDDNKFVVKHVPPKKSIGNETDDAAGNEASSKTTSTDDKKHGRRATVSTTSDDDDDDDGVYYTPLIVDSNAIKLNLENGTLAPADAVELVDTFVDLIYQSTPNVNQDPYACELGGLAKLDCGIPAEGRPSLLLETGEPVRSVGLAGLFVPAPWATSGHELTLEDASDLYTTKDFADMKQSGLNAVQIAVPLTAFEEEKSTDDDDKRPFTVLSVLSSLLDKADRADLRAILVLATKDKTKKTAALSSADLDLVRAAASYCHDSKTVVALTLPSKHETTIAAAREQAANLPLMIPVNMGDLIHLKAASDDPRVFAALELSHASTIGDIASSTSLGDRMKLFYHEATACMARSPIEFTACYREMPVFVTSGFDLSIDDCVHRFVDSGVKWNDYGQCDRLNETTTSGWWQRHRQSFAARQLVAYEQPGSLGWSFATWKLYTKHGDTKKDGIDDFAQLLSLRDVMAAGLFPSPTNASEYSLACLNPPLPDFEMGDATYAPTGSPPPDCGNGWWNDQTHQCDYWVPPQPTAAPTPCPDCNELLANATAACPQQEYDGFQAPPHPRATVIAVKASVISSLVTAIVMLILYKVLGKRSGYTSLPN